MFCQGSFSQMCIEQIIDVAIMMFLNKPSKQNVRRVPVYRICVYYDKNLFLIVLTSQELSDENLRT